MIYQMEKIIYSKEVNKGLLQGEDSSCSVYPSNLRRANIVSYEWLNLAEI